MDNRFIFTDGDFTFTGTDGRTYGWDSNGTPTPVQPINLTVPNTGESYGNSTTSNHSGVGVSTTSANNVAADRWTNIASRPFQPISNGPSQPLIENNLTPSLSNTTSIFQPSFQPTPNLSIPQPNIPTGNTQVVGGDRKSKDVDGVNHQVKAVINNSENLMGLSDCDLTAHDMNYLSATLPSNSYNLTLVNFSNNPQIGALGIDYLLKGAPGILSLQSSNHDINLMYQGMLTRPGLNTVKLDLSNCNIGDIGADILGHALASGKLPATKKINISGNNITQDGGDTKIVQALKSVEQDIVVFTHTLDEINKMSGDEGKEAQITALKNIIERGKAAGTYNEALVVDKSFLGNLKNTFKVGELGLEQLFGFGKCHLLPEPEQIVESYAQDKIIASLPQKTASGLSFAKKYVGKLISFHDIVTCFVDSYEDSVTSELGQEVVKHELCVVGVDEFCGE